MTQSITKKRKPSLIYRWRYASMLISNSFQKLNQRLSLFSILLLQILFSLFMKNDATLSFLWLFYKKRLIVRFLQGIMNYTCWSNFNWSRHTCSDLNWRPVHSARVLLRICSWWVCKSMLFNVDIVTMEYRTCSKTVTSI